MVASFPGSPLAPTKNKNGARGEPGNEAILVVVTDPPFQFTVTEVMTGSITSTATVTATVDLNGTLVVCQDCVRMLPDQSKTINISENGACTVV